MSEGYLVVLKSPPRVLQSANPRYKGLFRMRPFYVKEYEGGFDDPYFSGKFTDKNGLIPTRSIAKEVKRLLACVEPLEQLEIIYAQTVELGNLVESSDDVNSFRFIGYDIACYAPFWSIVVDILPSSGQRLQRMLGQLNEYGLFNSVELANNYSSSYLSQHTELGDLALKIWRISLVEEDP